MGTGGNGLVEQWIDGLVEAPRLSTGPLSLPETPRASGSIAQTSQKRGFLLLIQPLEESLIYFAFRASRMVRASGNAPDPGTDLVRCEV